MTREMTVPRDRWEEDDEVVVTAWMYDDGARVKAGTVVVEVMVVVLDVVVCVVL